MRTRELEFAGIVGVALAVASQAAADDVAVQKLLDRAEIEGLVTRYVTGLDTLDADLYASGFAEDAVFELPGGVVHRGRAAIRKIVTDLQESRARNQASGTPSASLYHVMANTSIDVIDATNARHVSYAQTVRAVEGGQFIVGFMGRYEDVLVKRDGHWYIQSRKLVSFVRAAGRTIAPDLTIEGMAQDGIELCEWLRSRLDKDRIILLGWSWGSILGVQMVKARPELFAAYVGTGQVVAMQEGEEIAYANVLAKARQRADSAAMAELDAIGPPPYDGLAEIEAQRKWAALYELGRALEPAFVLPQLFAPRTTLVDIYDLARATLASTRHFVGPTMTGPMTEIDLRKLGLEFAVPMFVIQGVADDFTPAELSRAWLDSISARQKAFVPIENAGHFALTERSEEFLRALRERVQPLG